MANVNKVAPTVDRIVEGKVNQGRELGIPAFTHKGGDPNRQAVLESNKRIREGLEPGPRDFGAGGGFGRVQFRIPEFDYPFLCAMFPDLNSSDATVQKKAWQKFAKSPLSEKYKVDTKQRGRISVPQLRNP